MDSSLGAIVVAVYKPDARLLRRQLASIREQSATNWTCIVGIDGPDTEAARWAQEAVGDDGRFEIIEFPDNRGVYRHYERMLAMLPASIDWVALADQDDFWFPLKLEVLSAQVRERGVVAAIARARVVTEDGSFLGLTRRRVGGKYDLLLLNQVTGSQALFTREVVVSALPFPEGVSGAIHDHWLAVCASRLGTIANRGIVLQHYVQHSGNLIGESRLRSPRDLLSQVLRRQFDTARFIDDPWRWRAVLAKGLMRHFPESSSDGTLAAIAAQRLTPHVVVLLATQAIRLRTPLRVTAALAWGAMRSGIRPPR